MSQSISGSLQVNNTRKTSNMDFLATFLGVLVVSSATLANPQYAPAPQELIVPSAPIVIPPQAEFELAPEARYIAAPPPAPSPLPLYAPESTYSVPAPAPAYQVPVPVYQAPTPVYAAPAPIYAAPAPPVPFAEYGPPASPPHFAPIIPLIPEPDTSFNFAPSPLIPPPPPEITALEAPIARQEISFTSGSIYS